MYYDMMRICVTVLMFGYTIGTTLPSTRHENASTTAATSIATPTSVNISRPRSNLSPREQQTARLHEWQRQARLYMFQRQVLRGIGLTNIPTPSAFSDTDIESLLREYNINSTRENNHRLATGNYQCIVSSCSVRSPINRVVWNNSTYLGMRLYFDLGSFTGNARQISSATLKIHMKSSPGNCKNQPSTPRREQHVMVFLYRYMRPVRRRRRATRKLLLDMKRATIGVNTVLSYEIERVVQDWLRNANKNFGLEVLVKTEEEVPLHYRDYISSFNCSETDHRACEPRISVPLGGEDTYNYLVSFDVNFTSPRLEIVSSGQSPVHLQRRWRRHVRLPTCTKATVNVSFPALGWDWIMSPSSYETGICVGTCARPNDIKGHYLPWHLASCTNCVPTRTRPLNVILRGDDGTPYIGRLDNYVVEECGCTS